MTYKMILIVILFCLFIAILLSVLCISRLNSRLKKVVEQVEIVNEMMQFNKQYLKYLQNNTFENLPYIDKYLRNTYKTICKIIEKSDFAFQKVVISSSKREDWIDNFIKEYEQSDNETKELLERNSKLINRVYKNKSPLKYRLNTIKKNLLLQILYFIVCMYEKVLNRKNNDYYNSKDTFNNKTINAT